MYRLSQDKQSFRINAIKHGDDEEVVVVVVEGENIPFSYVVLCIDTLVFVTTYEMAWSINDMNVFIRLNRESANIRIQSHPH